MGGPAVIPPSGWKIHGNGLRKSFLFSDFKTALAFVNRTAEARMKIRLAWGQVDVTIPADSGLAGKVDEAFFAIS